MLEFGQSWVSWFGDPSCNFAEALLRIMRGHSFSFISAIWSLTSCFGSKPPLILTEEFGKIPAKNWTTAPPLNPLLSLPAPPPSSASTCCYHFELIPTSLPRSHADNPRNIYSTCLGIFLFFLWLIYNFAIYKSYKWNANMPVYFPILLSLDSDFEGGNVAFVRTFKFSVNFKRESWFSQLWEVQKYNSLLVYSKIVHVFTPLHSSPPHTKQFTTPPSETIKQGCYRSSFFLNILNCFPSEIKGGLVLCQNFG